MKNEVTSLSIEWTFKGIICEETMINLVFWIEESLPKIMEYKIFGI
jgi:hypothetical protein